MGVQLNGDVLATDRMSDSHDYIPVQNSTTSFWLQQTDPIHNYQSSETLPEHSDVVIIGGGYAGVATAWHLIKDRPREAPPLSITLFEARGLCTGATGRNGGHLRPDYYGHIPTYIQRAGVEAGAELARFEIEHVQAIKKVIEQEQIECDFTLARSIDVWSNEKAALGAKKVYEQMRAHKLDYMDDVFFTYGKDAEGISGVKGAKACASYTAGMMYPYKFIVALTKRLLENKQLSIYTNTPVKTVTTDNTGKLSVLTSRGMISASKVVYANNGYVAGLLPEYSKNIVPCKGICCRITCPAARAPLLNNSYIERDEKNILSYLIPRADGSIVVGGSSAVFKPYREQWYNNIDDSNLIDASKGYYDGYMQRTFRGWEESGAKVDSIWTGVMGYSYDSNPHIGAVPNRQNQFVLAGFNGHGMPVIWLGAKGLAKMINEDASFEETTMPRLFKTTQTRIERAQDGREEDGDILGTGSFPATKQ